MKNAQVLSIAVGAILLVSCGDEHDVAEKAPRHVEVVVAAEKQLSRGSTITGEVHARVQTDLSFRVNGKIIARSVDVGSRVVAGQVLARLDPQEQKADLEIAKANLGSAKAQEQQAQLAFDRQTRLFEAQVTTRMALDKAQETLLTAKGNTRAAEANLDAARDTLSYTELRAEADGVITARNAEVGQVAQATQAVFTLAHDGPRDAVFDVYESLFLGDGLDGRVKVSLLAGAPVSTLAEIREIAPTVDTSTGTVKIKVGLSEDTVMPLGAAVAGHFSLKAGRAIALPWSAIASEAGRPAVWVIDPKTSRIHTRPIVVAGYQTGGLAVKQGLNTGDIVVATGTKFLTRNETVAYTKENAQ